MKKNNIEWGKEIIQAGSDVAGLAKDVGIPGVGLVARFIQHFYDTQLQKRFEKFISDAEIDEQLLSKVSESEIYSNCFYGILETVRQTHSRIGLIALALIYKERWNDETYLIAAMQAFSQVSDVTINAFISLYESIPEDKNHLTLKIQKGDESHFHNLYNEAVELIRRNFFVMSTGAGMHSNGPVQGMKWDHTDSYYVYCKLAKDRV
ncbi:hypothetical protein DW203_13840 [Citrobacter portucalensis]|uniref:hypothetical protein n=1 Tax=Enterobacterales TaxID=91347 RepID=UPI00038F919C|nr:MULTISPECIES: hypothetical protein [Enterobacterales]EQM94214.1 hypothetical protein CSAG_04803 [Citrobacter portucalensis]MDE9689842.1 hypothetical protein [Citrobacter portucalensis]RHH47959.1 hypothetical protein DW203_13840 [Citrobacter portucalensis]WOU49447.1 hypothetical protein R4T22_22625 [Citrobacter portucalensis]WOU50570.1 hypothetical protein R4T22_04825 [Citrobacter portucalensis]